MRQTIEMEIGGSRLIVSGDNLSISITDADEAEVTGAQICDSIAAPAKLRRFLGDRDVILPMDEELFRNELKQRGMNLTVLAGALGVNKSTASRWARNGVPVERLADVERITGIPRQKLRPDIFEVAA